MAKANDWHLCLCDKKYDTLFKSVQKQFTLVDASVEDPFIKLH